MGGVYPSSDSPVRVSWPKIILSSRSSSRFAPSTRLRRAARLPETLPRSAPVSLVISEDVGAAFSCVADTCFWRTCPSKRVTRRWQPSGADKEWRFGGLLTLGLRAVALSQGRLAVLDLLADGGHQIGAHAPLGLEHRQIVAGAGELKAVGSRSACRGLRR